MALPPKTIESIEQIAEKLERWANNRKRHKMLCNALPGLGCRTSLNEPLRGFGTILLKLKCWRPEAAKEVEKEHRKLLSLAKIIDKKIKDGQRDLVFPASALQVSANLLAKKLRTIAEMAREDLPLEKPREVTDDGLTKSQRLAYQSYQDAINQNPDIAEANDNDVYNWLKENGFSEDDSYELPSPETWKRYIRSGRKAHGTQKNTPRKGRAGRSIVKASQIEYTSNQQPD